MNVSNNTEADNSNSDSHNSHGNGNHITYFWNKVRGTVFVKHLADAYEKIAHWKRNLSVMPSGAVGGKYIKEVTRILKLWFPASPLKKIALKVIHVIPPLLL